MKRKTLDAIREHYAHAIAAHPKFCDRLDRVSVEQAEQALAKCRECLAFGEGFGETLAITVFECEVMELVVELARGDNARAREEALDCIAVLIRIIDELEAMP